MSHAVEAQSTHIANEKGAHGNGQKALTVFLFVRSNRSQCRESGACLNISFVDLDCLMSDGAEASSVVF